MTEFKGRQTINYAREKSVDDTCIAFSPMPMAVVSKTLNVPMVQSVLPGVKPAEERIPVRPQNLVSLANALSNVSKEPVDDILKKLIANTKEAVSMKVDTMSIEEVKLALGYMTMNPMIDVYRETQLDEYISNILQEAQNEVILESVSSDANLRNKLKAQLLGLPSITDIPEEYSLVPQGAELKRREILPFEPEPVPVEPEPVEEQVERRGGRRMGAGRPTTAEKRIMRELKEGHGIPATKTGVRTAREIIGELVSSAVERVEL